MDTPAPLLASALVALGGAIGSLLRYQVGRVMTYWLGVFKEDSAYSPEDVANAEGKVEVLEWAIEQVTARAKKAAA